MVKIKNFCLTKLLEHRQRARSAKHCRSDLVEEAKFLNLQSKQLNSGQDPQKQLNK